ncbi:MAG TPA: efflux RND transporter permease subunit [Candidatus Limnocylindrales bacterium]|nr:efflux RND transporter permease subunit [Candidatus Limnocylindrales bacterium]
MSRLSELAVAKRSVTLLLAAALFIAGISAWGRLQQELLPDIDFPVITVVAPLPGASATDVASQVAEPIERAISGVPRLEKLQSTSANSVALVVAQFSFGTDVKETQATIEDNIAGAGLPQSVKPDVSALNINASPVVIASIAAKDEQGLDDAAAVARSEIVPDILGLEGVASADLTGGLEQQVLVTLDPDKLAETGITVAQISGVLQANHVTLPSGQLSADGEKVPVSTTGELGSVAAIRDLVVGVKRPTAAPQGPSAASPTPSQSQASGAPTTPVTPVAPTAAQPTPVTLGDLGTVEEEGVATTGYARTNGNPALTLTVTKTSTANTVQVAEAVEAALDEAGTRHADTLTVAVVQDLSSFIKESQNGLLREGGLGALFAVITIFLFLFSLRSTLVAAISIPLSVLTALVIMQVAGISLNIMTLGGLAVAVGRVVDDAIVVLENIYRHRALGEDRLTAVTRGPREVAGAITASTLTTVAVFLPLGFVGGLVTQFFLPFSLTVTFALLASLVCALTVVPVLAYLVIDRVSLSVDEHGEPKRSFWIRAYVPTISFALRNRWTKWGVLGIAAVLFVASLSLVGQLPTQFINAGSEKILQAVVIPPAGASSQTVLDQATQAESIAMDLPDVDLVQTSVPGEGDLGFRAVVAALQGQPANSATLTIRYVPGVDLDVKTQELSTALAPVKTDGFDVNVSEAAGFTSNNLNVVVSGEDTAAVEQTTATVLDALSDRDDLVNLKSDLVKATPAVTVSVDPNKAIGVGSTAAQIGAEVRAALTPTTATTTTVAGSSDPVDIVIQLDPDAVTSVEELRQLPVGTTVKAPLDTVATVKQEDIQGSITRIDGSPAAQVTAEIASPDTGAVSQEVRQEIDGLIASGQIPAGVDVTLAGVTQQQTEAFSGLFASMAVAVLLVYVMMVLAFNSLVTPFIILFSLPLAMIGAFPALYLSGRPIGVSALIGMLMLIGIVVTNAIVLLDLVERLRREGLSTHDALIEGGKTRVRPILMTAIATILALIPLAAGFNEGSIIAAELGTVVIGGLFSSTFLTLLVVPVVYSLVDGARVSATGWRPRRGAPEPVLAETAPAPASLAATSTAQVHRPAPAGGYPLTRIATSRPGSPRPGTSPDRP